LPYCSRAPRPGRATGAQNAMPLPIPRLQFCTATTLLGDTFTLNIILRCDADISTSALDLCADASPTFAVSLRAPTLTPPQKWRFRLSPALHLKLPFYLLRFPLYTYQFCSFFEWTVVRIAPSLLRFLCQHTIWRDRRTRLAKFPLTYAVDGRRHLLNSVYRTALTLFKPPLPYSVGGRRGPPPR